MPTNKFLSNLPNWMKKFLGKLRLIFIAVGENFPTKWANDLRHSTLVTNLNFHHPRDPGKFILNEMQLRIQTRNEFYNPQIYSYHIRSVHAPPLKYKIV